MLTLDYRRLVSRADLTYDKPPARSEEGLPIGNGRMGSLLWTTPSALKFQINRVDVYGNNSESTSFPERNTDYCGGCAFVDIDCVDFGDEPFPREGTRQHLSVYDATASVKGRGISARILAANDTDVMAVEISDQRDKPTPVSANLRMLRYAPSLEPMVSVFRTRSQTATSRMEIRGDKIILTQEFREESYYNASAVAIAINGRTAKARTENETTLKLSAEPRKGTFTLLIASAATFDPKEDIAAKALRHLDAAASKTFDALLESNQTWWHDFWSKAFIHLHSADGAADYIEQNYTYFLYVMAASSRGAFPPKFNGMIWSTNGDRRTWGAQHWGANLSCYYGALPPANRFELMDPMYRMYFNMYDACATAARQEWGSKGIYIPETTWFNGLAKLPDDLAEEIRDLYLLRKPWEERSLKFRQFAETQHPHSSRWNWKDKGQWVNGNYVATDRGAGPYGPVNHIFGTTAKIADYFWQRYEYTLDKQWLRDRAYPMLKGASEFYRNYPNLKKGADGKYHIHNVNSNEGVWGAQDTDEDLCALRGILPAAIRAAEVLDTDTGLRGLWKEFLAHLAPMPTSDHPDALKVSNAQGKRVWVRGLYPVIQARGGMPDSNTLPAWCFHLCHAETPDPETLRVANATYDAYFPNGITAQTPASVLSKLASAGTLLGRVEAAHFLIPNQMRVLAPQRDFVDRANTGQTGVLANRMTLREGPQAMDVQRLGRASEALHYALLQSEPVQPGREAIVRVFPAWPREWDAAFKLRARGAFLVTSSMRNGTIEFIEVHSEAGTECKLRNPWPESAVSLFRNGNRTDELTGSLLTIPTTASETLILVKQGTTPSQFRRAVKDFA